jgi:hypothetical protein
LTDAPLSGGLVALADRIELWPIDRVRPYQRNPRTHSDGQVDQIAASMVEFGWTNPVTSKAESWPATAGCWRRGSSVWPRFR